MQAAHVPLTVTIPPSARGFHLAGLVVQTRPDTTARGIHLLVRFLIPILVTVEGRAERQQVQFDDISLEFRPPTENVQGTTLVQVHVANAGRTYSRVSGTAQVLYQTGGRWRPVVTGMIKETGIIPGVRLVLGNDLARRLPPGRYKLLGTLYIDGRRQPALEKEVDFKGDPTVTTLPVDSDLRVEPAEVSLFGVAGATRTAVLSVENAGEDDVIVEGMSATPGPLRGVALGNLRGNALSCDEWLQLSPAEFTLRAGRKQNLRLVARIPRDGLEHPNYYGLVVLHATYPDGQSAGETPVLVTLTNKDEQAQPMGQVSQLALAAEQDGAYVVRAKAVNVGKVHFRPAVKAIVLTGQGQAALESLLTGPGGAMLPLEMRDYAGVVNIGALSPGEYVLRVVLETGSEPAAQEQVLIKVSEEDGRKEVTVVSPDSKQPATAAAGAQE